MRHAESLLAPLPLPNFQKESRKHPAKAPLKRLDWLIKYAEILDTEINKSPKNSFDRIELLQLSVRVWKNIASTIKLIGR